MALTGTIRKWHPTPLIGILLFTTLGAFLVGGCGSIVLSGASKSSGAPAITVAVSPGTATLAPGQQQLLAATVSGTSDQSVIWSVNGIDGGSTAFGTISIAGLYQAPSVAPPGGSVTITAVSVVDGKASAQAIFAITDTLTLDPAAASVAIAETQQFTAFLNGSLSQAVQWQVDGVTGGNLTVGSISATGLYQAPATMPSATITVTAIDAVNNQISANATVTIFDPAVLEAQNQWLSNASATAATFGCTDVSVQQQETETIDDAIVRFGATAAEGSCLVLWPVSNNLGTPRYSFAWGGTVSGKDILYLSDLGEMRIWNGAAVVLSESAASAEDRHP